jgi:hypothetical protein
MFKYCTGLHFDHIVAKEKIRTKPIENAKLLTSSTACTLWLLTHKGASNIHLTKRKDTENGVINTSRV